mmetsp:Transcript_9260/g.15038  ORF Transcript_9260/g.15038 Transcript_9260/m.15038 type:complete len:115 (+) Transcript_9260:92-436(+)
MCKNPNCTHVRGKVRAVLAKYWAQGCRLAIMVATRPFFQVKQAPSPEFLSPPKPSRSAPRLNPPTASAHPAPTGQCAKIQIAPTFGARSGLCWQNIGLKDVAWRLWLPLDRSFK